MPAALKIENLAAASTTVREWFKSVEAAAAEAAVGMAREAFEQVLETSPQYSGDFVANWKVSKNAPDTSFTPGIFTNGGRPLFRMGSSPAMAYARANAHWPELKLGESIFLSNSASHTEPYALKIEHGLIKLRPVNEGGAYVAQRAARYVLHRYTKIGKVQLEILRKLGL